MPTDPWAWSLDSVLALIGVVVAGLGAVATVLIASFALGATNRANRLEAEARERAGRVALSSAVDAYLSEWIPEPYIGASIEGMDAANALTAAAAGVSPEAEKVAKWVLDALTTAVRETMEETADSDEVLKDGLRSITALGAPLAARKRITVWVATGVLDDSPLFTPRQ